MALGARAVAVLAALVERPNEYVQKASILDSAWPGVVVEESNLAVQISSIRRVLAHAPGGERWVETLARRGYRFVGPVSEVCGSLPKGTSGERPNSNLPEPLTSFVGRERELVEIKRLLPDTRLLTLVGIGGIGKTRLALQAAAEVLAAYRDGVWLVDLAPLVDPALVPSAVAQVLGVRETAGKPLVETLCNQAKGRQLLLLLDNCEHLLGASAGLADAMLRAAAGLTIIATSREPLRVAGEQTYALATLSLPDPAATGEGVARSEAVQLFMDRAQRQQPGFALTADRIPAVAQLCIRLDGIPLALELAAARLRSLSIEQINARLDDRFRLLTGGAHTALPRQKTLRATLDWSYDLLAEQERAVLRRLAVFAGGFTLEAASAVASDGGIDEFAAIDVLSQLVARSLVVADMGNAETRYRLLETTRTYALEKLAEAAETDAIQRRHAQHFRVRFDRAPDGWWRLSDENWSATYLPELDNVRTALEWGLGARGEPAIGIALAGASHPMWIELSLYAEGVKRLEAALARVGPETPAMDRARLWKGLGTLWGDSKAAEKAVAAHERAADLFAKLDDPLDLGHALVQMGQMLAHLGRLEEARRIYEQAFPILERAAVPRAWGHYYRALGTLEKRMGEPAAARAHNQRALQFYESAGAERHVLSILTNQADLTWAYGNLDEALQATLEAVAHLRKSPRARKNSVGTGLVNLAGIHVERGELREALAAGRDGLPLLREVGMAWSMIDHLALRAALAGHLAIAALLSGYSDAAHAANKWSREPNEARAHKRLQELLREKLAAEELEQHLSQGRTMSDDEACRLALEE
jgi:predicted ATPase/DNA-binding winged helix-turn-helix (wHTH) protein